MKQQYDIIKVPGIRINEVFWQVVNVEGEPMSVPSTMQKAKEQLAKLQKGS